MKNMCSIAKLELKERFSFPFLEILIVLVFFLLLPIDFANKLEIKTSILELYTLRDVYPYIFKAIVYLNIKLLRYQYSIISLLLPIIFAYSIGHSIERGEAETILINPVSRFEYLSGKLIANILYSLIIFLSPTILTLFLELPGLIDPINYFGLFVCSVINILYISSIVTFFSIIIKRNWLISTIVSISLWFIINFMVELGYVSYPYYYIIPVSLMRILFILTLSSVIAKYPNIIIGFLGHPLEEIPINFILLTVLSIILLSFLISFIVFCKFVEFER
ncbi:MAG: hypothetical protein NDF54_10670 [archaeon GB-1867-035]|nr:hypothetical protein [Candidatus Culexmicrobium profundum]